MRNTLIAGLLALSAASAFAQDGSRPQQIAAANAASAMVQQMKQQAMPYSNPKVWEFLGKAMAYRTGADI